jgi:hypothetical protein
MAGNKESAWLTVGMGIGGALTGGLLFAGSALAISLGYMGGTILGNLLFPQQNKMESVSITDYGVQNSAKGIPIPKVYGTRPIAGNVIWMGDLHPYTVEHEGQGKGGGDAGAYDETRYRRSFLIALCYGPASCLRAWKGKVEIPLTDFTWFTGQNNSGIGALIDEDYAEYRNVACAYFDEYDLGGYSGLPNFTFEVSSSAAASAYRYSWISENNEVWGVPFQGSNGLIGLDLGGVAVDNGGGLVSLPFFGHPYEVGNTVVIDGTTNYEGVYTLQAGTSTTHIQITETFNAETFNGDEHVFRYIYPLKSGAGRSTLSSDGYLYYAHINSGTPPNVSYITRIAPDGTQSEDYNWLNIAWNDISATCPGVELSADERYLYIFIDVDGPTDYGYVYKFDLVTGDKIWNTTPDVSINSWPGYSLGVASNGDAYFQSHGGDDNAVRVDSNTGVSSKIPGTGSAYPNVNTSVIIYDTVVDDEIGIVIFGGYQQASLAYPDATMYNVSAVSTTKLGSPPFDSYVSSQILVGEKYTGALIETPVIGQGHITTLNGYIYVLAFNETLLQWEMFKLSWDPVNGLSEVNFVVLTYSSACGIFTNPAGQLVVVNQNNAGTQTTVFYYYDADMDLITSSDNCSNMLRAWNATVGGSWLGGNVDHLGTDYGEIDLLDVNFAAMCYDLMLDTNYGGSIPEDALDIDSWIDSLQYCEDEGLKGSLVISAQKPLWDWITFICAHFQGYKFRTSGKIGLGVFKSTSSVASLVRTDLAALTGQAPIKVKKRNYTDTLNQIEVRWTDRDATYASDIAIGRDKVDQRVSGGVRKKTIDLNGITRPALAQFMADRILIDALYRFNFYSFAVTFKNMRLENSDVIDVNDGFKVNDSMRIMKAIEDKNAREISIEAIEDISALYPSFASAGSAPQSQAPQPVAPIMGDSIITFKEDLTTPTLKLCISPTNINVNGWNIFKSYDNNSYSHIGAATISGVTGGQANAVGTLLTPMHAHPTVCWRQHESILVDIGAIVDLDTAINDIDFFAGRKQLLIDDEIVGYKTCLETITEGIWRITGLIRGMDNTKPTAHAVNASIATLNTNFSYYIRNEDLGSTIYFKAVPYEGSYAQSLSDTTTYTRTIIGRHRQPLPFSTLRLQGRDWIHTYKGEDFVVQWDRCFRASGYGRGGYGTALWGAAQVEDSIQNIQAILTDKNGIVLTSGVYNITLISPVTGLQVYAADIASNDPVNISLLPIGVESGLYAESLEVETWK